MSKNYYNCNVGIGFLSENNYRDQPLEYLPYGSCGTVFIKKDKNPALKSYQTFVLQKDVNGYVQCTGIYSRTTIKHIAAWLKEFAPKISYHTMKQCYIKNLAIHAENGNIVELDGKFDVYGFQGVKE